MLSPKTIKKVVSTWNLLFSGNKTEPEQAVICAKFWKACQGVYNDETFLLAAEMVEKEVRFFPTIKDMMDVRNSVYQSAEARKPDYSRPAITEEAGCSTPEEEEKNRRRVEIMVSMLAGQLSIEEAIKEQNKLAFGA